ncbi:hypothetical protein [Thalassovita taeanensis]
MGNNGWDTISGGQGNDRLHGVQNRPLSRRNLPRDGAAKT